MAIPKEQLKTIGFFQVKDKNELIRPVGDDIIFTAAGSHIYFNGMHLINTEFIDLAFFKTYIEKVIEGKRKHNRNMPKVDAE